VKPKGKAIVEESGGKQRRWNWRENNEILQIDVSIGVVIHLSVCILNNIALHAPGRNPTRLRLSAQDMCFVKE
jgi:hypothetical protein